MNQKRSDEEIQQDRKQRKEKRRKEVMSWIIPYVTVFVIACAVLLCFRIVNVSGSSMLDSYKDGDIVVVNSIGYALSDKTLDAGTVVVVKPTGEMQYDIIKRVIAVGGDEINIDFTSGAVSVNGKVLTEEYIKEPTHLDEGAHDYPVTVPEGHYFVMGDNRNFSTDSRSALVGFVPKEDILGTVMFKIPKLF